MKRSILFAFSAFLALWAAPALAQSNQSVQGMQGMNMNGSGMGHMAMMGEHQMAVTVTSVNINTGMMEATADGMVLRLHFPPASLASVKAGDKITLHMAFMK